MTTTKVSPKSITPTSGPRKFVPNFDKISPKVAEKAKEEIGSVKGVFRIYEQGRSGSSEKVTCKKYPESICPMFAMVMTDGAEYEIPLYVARFLNGIDSNAEFIDGKVHTCSFPTHGWKMSGTEPMKEGYLGYGPEPNPLLEVAKRTRRFGFESLEFASGLK